MAADNRKLQLSGLRFPRARVCHSINTGVLLEGTLAVETEEGKNLVLQAGDPIIEVVDHWHRGTNVGKDPAEIIVFYAGTVGTPNTVKKIADP